MTQKPKPSLPLHLPSAILLVLISALTGATVYLSWLYPGWCVSFNPSQGYRIILSGQVCDFLLKRTP